MAGPKNAVKKRIHVAEADKRATYSNKAGPRRAVGTLFLVGLRGSGKSTVGARLAGEIGRTFVDTDQRIEKAAQTTIAQYVAANGWERFRELERRVLAEVCQGENLVVATGGGIVLDAENRRLLRESGRTFYLRAEPEVLAARLANDPDPDKRPALTHEADPAAEMRALFVEREPLYMEVANFILPAAAPVDDVVAEAREKLALFGF